MLLGKSSDYQQIFAADKTEARLVLAALYLLLLLPISMIFARTTAEIISGLIGALFLFHSYRQQNWKWLREPPVVIALLLWAYSVLIVSPLALDPRASFARSDWVRFIPMFAAIVYWLSGFHQELRQIAQIVLWVLLCVALDALYHYATDFSLLDLLEFSYVEENLAIPSKMAGVGIYIAKISTPLLGIMLYYACHEHKKYLKVALFFLALLFFAVILLSDERAAVLTFTLGLSLTGGALSYTFPQSRKIVFGLLLAMAIVFLIAYKTQPILQEHFHITEEKIENFSNSEYAQIWKASILLWQDHPITGVGMLNFRSACSVLLEQGRVLFCDTHSHNLYLEVLSEFGTIGFMLLLMLVVSLITVLFEQHSSRPCERVILTFVAAAGLLINFFPLAPTQSFFSNWPALLAWQSVAWSLAIMKVQHE
jgi:O-antigen ligase